MRKTQTKKTKRINLHLTMEQKNLLELNRSIFKVNYSRDSMTWEEYFLAISAEIQAELNRVLALKHA